MSDGKSVRIDLGEDPEPVPATRTSSGPTPQVAVPDAPLLQAARPRPRLDPARPILIEPGLYEALFGGRSPDETGTYIVQTTPSVFVS